MNKLSILLLTLLVIGTVMFSTKVYANTTSARIRVIHLSANTPAIDLSVKNGNTLISNISFKQTSEYIDIEPGNYTLDIKVANSPTVIVEKQNVLLSSGQMYSVYLSGTLNGTPPFQVTVSNDSSPSSSPLPLTTATPSSPYQVEDSDDDDDKKDKKEIKAKEKEQKRNAKTR